MRLDRAIEHEVWADQAESKKDDIAMRAFSRQAAKEYEVVAHAFVEVLDDVMGGVDLAQKAERAYRRGRSFARANAMVVKIAVYQAPCRPIRQDAHSEGGAAAT